VALVVNGQQNVLHKVLDVIRQGRKPAAQKRPQVRAQTFQKSLVSLGITVHALQQLRPQAHFSCFHVGQRHALGLYSFHAGGWLHVRELFFNDLGCHCAQAVTDAQIEPNQGQITLLR
jgi:hypothetical protein